MNEENQTSNKPKPLEIFIVFLSLGLSSFGGPIAHLGFFNQELVIKKKWLDSQLFSELVALCQFLPGPSSSQVGLSIGFIKGGFSGALAAWIGFTTPSAIILILFGYGYAVYSDVIPFGIIHGLKIFAVAIVAQAIWTMGLTFCKDVKCIIITVAVGILIVLAPTPLFQFSVIILSGVIGAFVFNISETKEQSKFQYLIKIRLALTLLLSFFILLFLLPILVNMSDNPFLSVIDSFYRAGSLVFGGGHVVLPLLQTEIVSAGFVSNEAFLAGYGAAQAMPGPLFTFAAYLGTVSGAYPNGLFGGLIALFAIYLPSFLLVIGVLPFWHELRKIIIFKKAIIGINAAVVGILIAAFISPVATNGILSLHDFIAAFVLFLLIHFSKAPIWTLVIMASIECWIFNAIF
jgi:chromate transporter|tara:strand:+ start:1953 stop:3164 length:1212 start_codon:yes stop_codon:yes gene_type:complete